MNKSRACLTCLTFFMFLLKSNQTTSKIASIIKTQKVDDTSSCWHEFFSTCLIKSNSLSIRFSFSFFSRLLTRQFPCFVFIRMSCILKDQSYQYSFHQDITRPKSSNEASHRQSMLNVYFSLFHCQLFFFEIEAFVVCIVSFNNSKLMKW